jgi:NADH:ubiquinone oxidoreductase subunit 6 (subunit J)
MLLVYVGAVSILLLFVLMILDTKFLLFETKMSYKYLYAYFIFFICWEIFFIIYSNKQLIYHVLYVHIDYMKILNMQDELVVLADILYNKSIMSLLIVGVILLSVLIGAISIISIKRRNAFKKQYLMDQLNADCQTLYLRRNRKNKKP